MKLILTYLATAIAFGLLDFLWLRWAGPNLYRPALGDLLAPQFRAGPALAFYVIYIAALVWFAVLPGVMAGVPFAVLNGAVLGAVCYATYDLTNQATLRHWPLSVTLIDIPWGAAASALAAGTAAFAVTKWG